MKKIEFEVPDIVLELPDTEKEKLINNMFTFSIKERLKILKKECKLAQEKLYEFEKKYNKNLEEFEKEGIDISTEAHDEYMDWCYWQSVYDKTSEIIEKYSTIFGDGVNAS